MNARVNWLALAWLCIASPALADIFKCPQQNGLDRYQNFPCSIDSIGSLPSGLASANADTGSPPGDAGRARPAAMAAAVARVDRSAAASEPRPGMSDDEVKAIWGEPDETEQDEPRDGHIEIWRYADGRFVQFSNKHRVLVVERRR